ncbi:MAG: hypothetical protein ACK4MV_02965 [Beijerinckiaceae bacterium]
MILRHSSSSRALVAAAGGALLFGLATTAPARALDDGAENIFISIGQLLTVGVGLGGEKSKPPIEYRERAPLVLPPNLQQLPPPGSGVAARTANWPQDSDVQRYRRRVARESSAREAYDEFGGRNAPKSVPGAPVAPAGGGSRGCGEDALDRPCNIEQFWNTMKNRKQGEQQIAVGQEPPRRSLTDPPAGYRRQMTEQKYTFEVRRDVDITDPRAQAAEEQRRRDAIARGEDPNR